MTVMIVGLLLFIGIHLVPVAQPLRARLIARLGDGAYRGLFSVIAGLGLVLIILGYYLRPDRAAVRGRTHWTARTRACYLMGCAG